MKKLIFITVVMCLFQQANAQNLISHIAPNTDEVAGFNLKNEELVFDTSNGIRMNFNGSLYTLSRVKAEVLPTFIKTTTNSINVSPGSIAINGKLYENTIL